MLGRLRQAVPKMILQVGGSISFAPHTADAKAKWLNYDTRHMLAELDPKPEFVTVATGTTQWDVVSMFVPDDIKGTHLDNNPAVQAAWAGMYVDAGPAFYLEHLKRLSAHKIQPYFVPGHIHQMEIIERLIRAGVYKGPLNMAIAGYGGGTLGRNPYHWMDFLRRCRQGASRPSGPACAADFAVRHGDRSQASTCASATRTTSGVPDKEAPPLSSRWKAPFGSRGVRPQGRERRWARKIMKVGVWYDSVGETLEHRPGLPTVATASRASSSGIRTARRRSRRSRRLASRWRIAWSHPATVNDTPRWRRSPQRKPGGWRTTPVGGRRACLPPFPEPVVAGRLSHFRNLWRRSKLATSIVTSRLADRATRRRRRLLAHFDGARRSRRGRNRQTPSFEPGQLDEFRRGQVPRRRAQNRSTQLSGTILKERLPFRVRPGIQ